MTWQRLEEVKRCARKEGKKNVKKEEGIRTKRIRKKEKEEKEKRG